MVPQHRSQWIHLLTTKASKHSTSLLRETTRPQDKACFFGSEKRRHCLRSGHGSNATSFIHVNSAPFLSVWNCLFQMMNLVWLRRKCLLSNWSLYCVGQNVPSRDPVQHMVDIRKATAECRGASERSSHVNRSRKSFATRSIVKRRLSINKRNPGPPSGERRCLRTTIAGKWHIITLQEASEYVDHELLTKLFHVTHYASCAILLNEDTFHPNIDVKSIYLHDTRRDLLDQVIEGEQGWVLQSVLSRAIFRRQPVSG